MRTVEGGGILVGGVDCFPIESGCPLEATFGVGVEAARFSAELVCLLLDTVGFTNLLLGGKIGDFGALRGEISLDFFIVT